MNSERGFRPRQKGVECRVEGCDDWCVSNDLCAKHNIAMRRYGNPLGKPATRKICKNKDCGREFEHKYDVTGYCSAKCYRSTPENKEKRYRAIKNWRKKNLEKAPERKG